MGFFSAVASAAKSVAGKVSSTAKKVVKNGKDKIKKVSKKVKKKVSKSWGTFTGKDKADKAKKTFYEAKEKYKKEKDKFNQKLETIVSSINYKLSKINNFKEEIYQKKVKKYAVLVNRMTNFNLSSEELFDDNFDFEYNLEKIRNEDNVILIDFEKNKVLNNFKAIFTFGSFTRKKARKSLEKAVEEKNKVDLNIEKMNSEISRLKLIDKALGNIYKYFEDLLEFFDQLMGRMNYSIENLRNTHLVQLNFTKNGKLDYNQLSKAQMNTFAATNTLMKILIDMGQRRYLKEKEIEIIEQDIEETSEEINKSNIYEKVKKVA